jgi:hypothetical protein
MEALRSSQQWEARGKHATLQFAYLRRVKISRIMLVARDLHQYSSKRIGLYECYYTQAFWSDNFFTSRQDRMNAGADQQTSALKNISYTSQLQGTGPEIVWTIQKSNKWIPYWEQREMLLFSVEKDVKVIVSFPSIVVSKLLHYEPDKSYTETDSATGWKFDFYIDETVNLLKIHQASAAACSQ